MDLSLLHPKLVHLPIALAVLMPLLSVSVALAWTRGWVHRRAWWAIVALQAILAGSAWAATWTGESDEERVESVVAESAIEAHEEAAEVFTWTVTGLLALFALGGGLPKERAGRYAAWAASVSTLVVLGLGYRVGEAGGDLVYRHGAARAFTAKAGPSAAAGRDFARDDDD